MVDYLIQIVLVGSKEQQLDLDLSARLEWMFLELHVTLAQPRINSSMTKDSDGLPELLHPPEACVLLGISRRLENEDHGIIVNDTHFIESLRV